MSMSLMEQVAAQAAGANEAEEQEWTELVVTVADETVTADEVVVALRKLGRDAAELEQAVGLLRRRREWAAGVEAGRAAEVTLADCARELAEAEQKLAKLIETHEAKLSPVLVRRDAARGVLSQAWSAERSLRESVSRTTRDKLLAGVVAEEQALASSREGLEKELRDLQRLVETAESFGESASTADLQRLPAAKQRLAALRKLLRESDDSAAVLASKRAAVERELLKPELW
jgi:hypothetical protein